MYSLFLDCLDSSAKRMLSLPFRLARQWLRTRPAPESVVIPIAVREVEERILTIDEQGNLRTVIRTRTLASFQGPTGVVEVEQARRHTLPGFGHVYPIAENEYLVFRDHMKLLADPQSAMSSAVRVAPRVLPESEHCEHPPVSAGSTMAVQAQGSVHGQTFAVVVVLAVVSVTVAVLTLPPRHAPSPSLAALTSTAPYTALIAMPNDWAMTPDPTTPVAEVQPTASPRQVSPANATKSLAHNGRAHVALAIRPWGDVYVNGKKRGISPPLRQLELKPGRHMVEVRNDAYPPYRIAIDLRGKATAKVAHDFTQSDAAAAKQPAPRLASMTRSHPRFLSEEWPR